MATFGPDIAGTANIADDAITAAKIAAGAVDTSEVADNTLTADDLGAGSVADSELAGAIPDSKLATIATTGKVSGAAVTLLTSVPAGAGNLPIANVPPIPLLVESTIFEDTAPFVEALVGTGTIAYSDNGLDMATGTTASSHATQRNNIAQAVMLTTNHDCFLAFTFKIAVMGTDFEFLGGVGVVNTTTGDVNTNETHIGFKVTRVASGTINLEGTNSSGTEATTGALTTVALDDIICVIAHIKGTSTVNYYWSKNGSAFSGPTAVSTSVPVVTASYLNFQLGNNAAASDTRVRIGCRSFTAML